MVLAANIEIKARIPSVEAIRPLVEKLADQGPYELVQDDTFFACANGRLKLRTGAAAQGAELIFYRRSDQPGPKESSYIRSLAADPDGLRMALSLAYGQTGRVQKHRTLFLIGRTRVHLDTVSGLGTFLELEVVLAPGEPSEAGVAVADELLGRLGIDADQLIARAYVDLLSSRGGGEEA